MKKILRIAKTELQTLFYSPVAWLILIVFAFQLGFIISDNYVDWARRKTLGYAIFPLSQMIFSFQSLKGYLYFYLPLLTMGVISREYASGSIKLLYSSPVSNLQIVLGKYLAMVGYCFALLSLLVPFLVLGGVLIQNFQWIEALTPILGLFLLICAYAAIGLFTSSLTSYQVVAAMGTLCVLTLLNYAGKIAQDIPFIRELTYWIWLSGKADSFLQGLISSQDFLYFIIVICLFLALTVIRFQTIKKSGPWYLKAVKYVGAVLIAVSMGYFSSRPKLMFYHDVMHTQENTLSVGSQEIMEKVTGGLTITTYVNLFHPTFKFAGPSEFNSDKSRFDKYARFKPEMNLKYVYYYRKPDVKVITPKELKAQREDAQKVCETMGFDFDLFLDPNQIDKLIDLSGEKYQLTRLIERENGQKAFLRTYDDPINPLPEEREITAAFKRLVMKLPKIGYIQGYGQRGLNDDSDRGYSNIMSNPASRQALINQGMDVDEINLSYGEDIPADMSLIVIADGKVPFESEAIEKIMKFVQLGGNVIVLGEVNHQAALNPLVNQFGVRFLPGELVQKQTVGLPNLVFGNHTLESRKVSYLYDYFKYGYQLMLPGAVAIVPEQDKGFKYTPLFTTDSVGSWNELNTVNFIDEVPQIDDAKEEEKPNTVGAMLERKINGKSQKIFIVGDADCLSNLGLSKNYRGVSIAKDELILGMLDNVSGGKVPINIVRPLSVDNDIAISMKKASYIKIFAMYIIPALLAIGSVILLIRRKRK
ncbi:ABC-2 type transport system permease protein [Pedobacter steynii]|uniref:ABC-2 type transport system permease protein n=1 Tax=Pedobacter steynii TaxID=430522 RepID=A0A1G9K2I1_9SPHI|nr:Gldg family protein [Pedobacter steynii]NQX38428.1 Gldg family protein [Pedobacter steynii]SDL43948.1 ABC-2 type transport system permease protein [Pedobacter steynii]